MTGETSCPGLTVLITRPLNVQIYCPKTAAGITAVLSTCASRNAHHDLPGRELLAADTGVAARRSDILSLTPLTAPFSTLPREMQRLLRSYPWRTQYR